MTYVTNKVAVYLLSLFPLLILVAILKFPHYDGFCDIFKLSFVNDNFAFFISISLSILIVIIAYIYLTFKLKGSPELKFTIIEIRDISYEQLSYLTNNLIPLIAFIDGNQKHLVVFVTLLILTGAISITSNTFYKNPTLALLGFRLYQIDGSFEGGVSHQGIFLLARKTLTKGG